MPAQYLLRCLGEPGLFSVGGRPIKLRTRKQLGLLCFLAMEPRHHSRDELGDLLWPQASRTEARHSLAVAISGLRGKLDRHLFEVSTDRVRLRPGVIDLDVARLVSGDILGTEFEEPLDVDGFLLGFELPDALPFAHWRDGEYARLLPNVRDALVVLIDRCRRTGDFRQIETLALRLLRFDALSEDGIRARMEARAFAGDRLSALRLFETWKSELATQLQAVPSPLVEGMALRLRRREWERPEAPDVPTVPTDQWRGRPFVGRMDEYRELYEAWEGAQRGKARHRLLLGDSGIGKSTLVERLTTAAGLEGATIARVQCHEVEREIPYAMVSGLLSQLVESTGASAAPPDALAELAQTIPAVRVRFPGLPTPSESEGEASRIRFTEAAHALIAAVAEEHPVVLVIDDVHHADDVSLAVLHRVVRLAETQPVLMLFLAQHAALHQSPQAARLRDQGASLGITPLEIKPLDDEEANRLLDLLLRDLELSPSVTIRRALAGAAAGLPLVLELLVRDWARSGEECLALRLDAVTADEGRKGELGGAYQMLLDRLVRTLDPATRNTLGVAAVLGPRLNDSSLYALGDLKVNDVMTGLAVLTDIRILRGAGDQLEFTNDLVRAHAYYGVPIPIRHLLHNRIADTLLTRATHGDDTLGLELAWHCMRCGRKDEAIQHLLLGARSSIRRGAVHEAERRLYSGLPALAGEELSRARYLLADLFQEQGRWKDSLLLLASAGSESQAVDWKCLEGRALVSSGMTTSAEAWELAPIVRSYLSDRTLSARTRLRALELAGAILFHHKHRDTAVSFLTAVREAVCDGWTADERLEWEVNGLYIAHHTHHALEQSEELLLRLEGLADRAGAHTAANSLSWRIRTGIALCHRRVGRYRDAVQELEAVLPLAYKLGKQDAIANGHTQLAACYMELGQPSNSSMHGGIGLAHASVVGEVQLLATYCVAMARATAGDRCGAIETVAKANTRVTPHIGRAALQCWRAQMADVYWLVGDESAALEAARSAVAEGMGVVDRNNCGAIARWIAILTRAGLADDVTRSAAEQVAGIQGATLWEEAARLSGLLALSRYGQGSAGPYSGALLATLDRLPGTIVPFLQSFQLPAVQT